jgi:nitrate/nitrite transporter NarK
VSYLNLRLGGESLTVVASALEAFWFRGKEISLAMGIDISLSNVGTALNDVVQPRFYKASGSLSLGMWVGFLTCALSLLGGVGSFYVDRHRETRDKSMQTVHY